MSSRPPRARRLAGALVDDRLLGGDLARIDAEEAEVADELVGERLEHLGRRTRRLGRARVSTSAALSPVPLIGGALLALRRRQAKYVTMASSNSATPMSLSFLAAVQKIGITVPAARALGRAAASSSSPTVAFRADIFPSGPRRFRRWRRPAASALGGQVDRAAGGRLGGRIEDADHAAEGWADADRER